MRLLREEIGSHKFFFAFLASLFSLFVFLGSGYFSYFVFAIAPLIVLVHLIFREIKHTLFFSILFLSFNALIFAIPGLYLGVMHLGLLSLGLYLVYEKSLEFTVKTVLGVKIEGFFKNAAYGVGLFIGMLVLLIILSLLLAPFGLADNKNVFEKIKTYPFYVLPIAFLIAPLGEEIFFRGYLSKKYGVLVSALIFSLAHIAYGSFFELLFAFIFGIASAFVLRRTGSLTGPILTHFLFNLYFVFIFSLVRILNLDV